jgi:glycolate oxidase FAD binding subunit
MRNDDIVEPLDAAGIASMLKWADDERLAVGIRGGGTKPAWGTRAARVDVTLSTRGLEEKIDHAAGDLVATVPAGATLDAVNDVLRRNRQWLPLDPPMSDRATIGGIVAANDSGPRRHRYGTPRDLVIGIEMALVDGRMAKAGGRVVKNVAGYDLSRLLCGSFGSLAVVTSATFKLVPVARASHTVVATVGDVRRLGELTLAISDLPLNPSAIELEAPPCQLLVRFESTPAAAEEQAKTAANLCVRHGARAMILDVEDEQRTWDEHGSRFWKTPTTIVKVSILPTDLADVLQAIADLCAASRVEHSVVGRAALGVLLVALSSGDVGAEAQVIDGLRRRLAGRRGTVVIVSGSESLQARVDPWGEIGDAFELMRALKAHFDPRGTLNPGRGPGGL